MPLMNYTTTVTAGRTIATVQTMLVKAGARAITVIYDPEGEALGMTFVLGTALGPRHFKLPVNTDAVYLVLQRDCVPGRYRSPEHAERVAWRIVKDWLAAQLAIIDTEMVTFDQVMLPYMQDDRGRTVFELYADRQLALGTGDGV